MLKKLSALGLIFMLTFSPAAVLAETNVELNQADEMETAEDNVEVTSENNTSKEENPEAEEDATNEKSKKSADNETEGLEEASNEADAKQSEGDSEAEEEEGKEEEGSDAEKAAETEEEQVEEEEDAEDIELLQADDELDLDNIYGTARGNIEYNVNKGYYVLDLQAGFSNHSGSQVIQDKWIGFALPNGISLANTDDIPSGVAQVTIKGKSGLAIKIPDVKEFPDDKKVFLDIPLVGEENDNDPIENLYILDVDVDNRSFNNLGQINSQRNIDFSVMEETPILDLDGTITGSTNYDNQEAYYNLEVTVQAQNNNDYDVNDAYVGFALPEGVDVVESRTGVRTINLGDDGRAIAVKLPDVESGSETETTYTIPIIGVSDEVVQSDTITL